MTQPLDLSDAPIAAIWREHHRHLIDVAYRMLGSVSDAEAVVRTSLAFTSDVSVARTTAGFLS